MMSRANELDAKVFLLVIFSILAIFSGFSRACPSACQCINNAPFLTSCIDQNLTKVPDDIPENTEELYLKGNNIQTLNVGAFSTVSSLKRLFFTHNNLRSIESDTFAGLTELVHLDLRWNQLTSVPAYGFSGLSSLKKLDLDFNHIQSIAESAFLYLNLTKLGLENNPHLVNISLDAFKDSAVSDLYIYGSSLSSQSVEAFKALKHSLQEFYWQGNQRPVHLPDNLFQGFKFIKLNLDNNRISDASFLKHVSTDDLSLVGNPIGPIDFSRYPMLRTVRSLHLDSTNSSRLDYNYLQNLAQLEILHLQENGITTLPESFRPIFSRLKSLKLDDNPLHCNCELIWFKQWLTSSSTKGVDVTGTKCFTPFEEEIIAVNEESLQCSSPKLINITRTVTVKQGALLTLTCTAEGDPTPQIRWNLPSGKSKTFSSFNRTETVIRRDYQKDAKLADNGTYYCFAINALGNDSAAAEVKVIAPGRSSAVVSAPSVIIYSAFILLLSTVSFC